MRYIFSVIAVSTFLLATVSDAEQIKRCRHPAISPDGKTIAFAYRGDVWTVPATGGIATRLTVHNARDLAPVFSPDGKTIAFSSNRYGSFDVFTIPITGGAPTRLTFNSSAEWPESYTTDGKWILCRAGMYGRTDVYKVPADGGQPIRITGDDWESEYLMSVAPDMKTVAVNVLGEAGGWRRRGFESSGNADIWLAEFGTPVVWKKKLTDYQGNDLGPMFSPDGKTIYYVSDQGETPNVWKMDTDGESKRQVTRHKGDGVRNMKLARNGEKMVYEYDSQIWIADARSGDSHVVPIEAPTDQRENFLRRQTFDTASEYEASPDGKKVALVVRGDVFVISAEDGGIAKQLTATPGRESNIIWEGDSFHIIFVSDRTGNKDLWKVDLRGNESPLTTTPLDENCPALTPDGKWITYHFADTEVRRIPIEGGDPQTLIEGPFIHAPLAGEPSFAWSPDGEWLAYTIIDETYQSNIWIVNVTTSEKHQMTNLFGGVGTPAWSPDGKHLSFISSMYADNDIYVLDLLPRKIEFAEDALDKLIDDTEKEIAQKEEEPKPTETATTETQPAAESGEKPEEPSNRVEFQMEGIENRLRRIIDWGGWDGEQLYTKDGKSIVFVAGKDQQIWQVGEDGKNPTQLTNGSGKGGLTLSADGNRVWYIADGKPGWIDINNRSVKDLSFSAVMDIDLIRENRQVFNEAWWVLDRNFYDPKFHGHNWNAVREKYSALIDWVPQKDDFYELMAEMVEELDASHLGIGGPTEYTAPTSDDTAYIGVEPDWREFETTGLFKVARVLPKSPADNQYSKVEVGEYILAIDGVELSRNALYDTLMNRKVGKKVLLKVNKEPKLDGAREVAIKPINRSDYGNLIYDAWVESRRAITDELSGGRVAYLHIREMNGACLEQFKRELVTKTRGKDAMIVDVRYNGGGRIAHELLTILQKRPFCLMSARNFTPLDEMDITGDFWGKPAACLINQNSVSNSEMFAEGFRTLGLGPVVGITTAGGVIATVSWSLMDGGTVRLPQWGVYTLTGEDMEGKGREPDYGVPYDPNTFNRADQDPTVAKSVELLLKELESQPKKKVTPRTWPGSGRK